MGIKTAFKTFVHSEVRTSLGFKLVEAYLSHNQHINASKKNSGYQAVGKRSFCNGLKNVATITAEPDYTLDSIFKDLPASAPNATDELHTMKEKFTTPEVLKPQQQKRHEVYKVLSDFQPIGRSVNSRF